LAFARAHLGDLARMQGEAADELHIEMTQPELAAGRFAHQRKRLGHQIVERGTGRISRLEFLRLLGKLFISQRTDAGFEAIDRRDRAAQLLHESLITAAKNLSQKLPHEGESLKNWVLYG